MFTIFADGDIAHTVGTYVTGICSVITALVAGYIAIMQAKEKIRAKERFDEAQAQRVNFNTKLDVVHDKIQPLVDRESSMGMPASPLVPDYSRKESK